MTCLLIGKLNKGLNNSGKYKICLTDEEQKTLFDNQVPKSIGCGTFACAYEDPRNPNRVIKITHDADDVISTTIASQYGEERVTQLFGVYKLTNPGIMAKGRIEIPVYAMRVERLNEVPVRQRRQINRMLHPIAQFALWRHATGDTSSYTHGQLRLSMLGECPREDDGTFACQSFVAEFIDALERLNAAGIAFRDIHVGNLGVDNRGNWKILDLGMSSPDLSMAPDALEDPL